VNPDGAPTRVRTLRCSAPTGSTLRSAKGPVDRRPTLRNGLVSARAGRDSSTLRPLALLLALVGLVGCDRLELAPAPEPAFDHDAQPDIAPIPAPEPEPEHRERVDSRPPPMARPVPLWERGRAEREVDAATADVEGYLLLDLGEAWTPYLFTERTNETEQRIPHEYRETYLALARGERPDDHHGARAERDKYLELYGILPTLGLLRERMRAVRGLECAASLDLAPLQSFDGFVAYQNNTVARRQADHLRYLEHQVGQLVAGQRVATEAALDETRLDDRERRALREYRRDRPRFHAIRAAQARLECEGYFEGKGAYVRGAIDWATHEALAEFERRHRVYGWGYVGGETLARLRETPLELERQAVVRVLTERAMHALGVIEDGSVPPRADGTPRTFRGRDGQTHEVPNLEVEVQRRIVEALGLDTPESTLDMLEGLGELTPSSERVIAIQAPRLPEYYDADMDIRIEIDRGDVWYEFPYDAQGRERAQPVERRPRLSVLVEYEGQRIPIARFGTTIGGWRTEQIEGSTWWRYKSSPTGPRIWHQIVSAPVWMPPESTPARDLLGRTARGFAVNYHETGPSYASAYGLVAAYHRMFDEGADGTFRHRGDEGIRTHGSVDYMSIMRRHSHGCHRLHNHIAVRLMSWVLAHRPHRRVGHQQVAFRRSIQHEGRTYEMAIDRGGYVFDLERPIVVEVLEGRIRGERATPIEEPMPRWNEQAAAYVLPNGQPVTVSPLGVVTPVAPAALDGGVPAPVPGAVAPTPAPSQE
jgi:hypothetical protein